MQAWSMRACDSGAFQVALESLATCLNERHEIAAHFPWEKIGDPDEAAASVPRFDHLHRRVMERHAGYVHSRVRDAACFIVNVQDTFANDHPVGESHGAFVALQFTVNQHGSEQHVSLAHATKGCPRLVNADVHRNLVMN